MNHDARPPDAPSDTVEAPTSPVVPAAWLQQSADRCHALEDERDALVDRLELVEQRTTKAIAALDHAVDAHRATLTRLRRARSRAAIAEWRLQRLDSRRSVQVANLLAGAVRHPTGVLRLPRQLIEVARSTPFDEAHPPDERRAADPGARASRRLTRWRSRAVPPAPVKRSVPAVPLSAMTPLPGTHFAELRASGAADWPARTFGDLRPSFRYKLRESQRQQFIARSFGGRQRLWAYNSKHAGYQVALDAGLQVPEQYSDSMTFDRFDVSELPERFVIKPIQGTFSRGIFLLERRGEYYVDHMDGANKSLDEVRESYEQLVRSGVISRTFTVEELLRPHPSIASEIDLPDDFKVHCFADRPAIIMQRRLHGSAEPEQWTFKFWSSDWEDLGPVINQDRLDPSLQKPHLAAELVEAGARIGGHINAPYCRYDFYETDRGVVFGEVSPHPGGRQIWTKEIDVLLGVEWELSQAKLAVGDRNHIEALDS